MSICRLEVKEITIEKRVDNVQLIDTYNLAKAIVASIRAYDAAIPERYPSSLAERVLDLLKTGQQEDIKPITTNTKKGQ